MQINILGVVYKHFDVEDKSDFEFLSNLSVIEKHYKEILKKRNYQFMFEQWIYKLCEKVPNRRNEVR